jgi:hypothetical protein
VIEITGTCIITGTVICDVLPVTTLTTLTRLVRKKIVTRISSLLCESFLLEHLDEESE